MIFAISVICSEQPVQMSIMKLRSIPSPSCATYWRKPGLSPRSPVAEPALCLRFLSEETKEAHYFLNSHWAMITATQAAMVTSWSATKTDR
jgi:hypothetical protein